MRYDNTLTCGNTTDLLQIYYELLARENSSTSNSETCPPDQCINSVEDSNSSNLQISQNEADVFSQDEELISILQYLQQIFPFDINNSSKRIGGYFFSDTVFSLSLKVLADAEINILKKGFCSDSEYN